MELSRKMFVSAVASFMVIALAVNTIFSSDIIKKTNDGNAEIFQNITNLYTQSDKTVAQAIPMMKTV